MKHRQIREGWLLLCAGLFLWDPIIGVKDYLPDIIGYLLLCIGVSRLADLNEEVEQAQKAFRAMLWVGFGKIVAGILVHGFLARNAETLNRYVQPVWTLVFSFSFLVLEWYFLLPGWKHFFKGLSQLAEFHNGSLLLKEKHERNVCERLGHFTSAFVIVRALCNVLPEMTILTSFEHDVGNPAFTIDLFSFVTLFRMLAVVISLIMGVCWLIRYFRFVCDGIRDTEWQESLRTCYRTKILPDVGLLLNRRVGTAFAFFRIGAIFGINLSLLYHGVLPDWIAVLIIFCGWLFLGKLLKLLPACIICGSILCVTGIIRTVRNEIYLKMYTPVDAEYLPEAYHLYQPVRMTGILESILAWLFFILLLHALWKMAEKNLFLYSDSNGRMSEHTVGQNRREVKNKMILASFFFTLSMVGKILETAFQSTYGWMWLLQFACSFAAALAFSSVLRCLSEQISDIYPIRKHE